MDWNQLLARVKGHKEEFDKAYKCLNKSLPIRKETIAKHAITLVERYNLIRKLATDNAKNLIKLRSLQLTDTLRRLRDQLAEVSAKHKLDMFLPPTFDKPGKEIEDNNSELNLDSSSVGQNFIMEQTVNEFLNLASKFLPDFDGSPNQLQSFLAALELVDGVNIGNDAVAIKLIKTKLKGTAITLISGTKTTVEQIIARLKTTVKGDSVELVTAKLMNIRQNSKMANAYAKVVEDLTKQLLSAYISDGLPPSLADSYSTKAAIKAIINQ